jgi:hypothetical protein
MACISREEAMRSPIYRRLTDKWQDETKLARGLSFGRLLVFFVADSGVAEVRTHGFLRKRRQLRLKREEMTK